MQVEIHEVHCSSSASLVRFRDSVPPLITSLPVPCSIQSRTFRHRWLYMDRGCNLLEHCSSLVASSHEDRSIVGQSRSNEANSAFAAHFVEHRGSQRNPIICPRNSSVESGFPLPLFRPLWSLTKLPGIRGGKTRRRGREKKVTTAIRKSCSSVYVVN